ncbi:MAG: FtsX-like permease family protein, partial [Bryobacteraceae bacterium]
SSAPLEGFTSNDLIFARDKDYAAGQIPPLRRYRFISPGFFDALGTPLIAGRDFTWTDIYQKRHVAMISKNMAREMWGDPRAALGKQIREGSAEPWREVVGVVGDVYDDGMQKKPPATVYWTAMMDEFEGWSPYATRNGVFAIRTDRAGTASFLVDAQKAIWSVDGNLPVYLTRTLQDLYEQSMQRTSFTLVLLGIAGAMALLLGIVGIYGVIAYAVSQRSREIGIRMALGAQPAELKRMFLKHGLLLGAVGAAIGLIAAAGLTQLMSSLLFGIGALDPATFAVVALILIAAAALASYIPARRATAVDPVEALRAE